MKWKKEEIDILEKHGSDLLTAELAPMLPNRSLSAIGSKCFVLGIRKTADCKIRQGKIAETFVDRDAYYKIDLGLTWDNLSNLHKQIFLGSILGDGCVTKHGVGKQRNMSFSESHGLKQRGYALWKQNCLELFKPNYYEYERDGSKAHCEIKTPSHPIFTMLRQEFYSGTKKDKDIIPMHRIEELDELGLMIWYLDDGHLGSDRYPQINNSGFGYDQLVKATNVINRKFKCSLHVNKFSSYNYIYFGESNIPMFLTKWQELVDLHKLPECMYYKLFRRDKKKMGPQCKLSQEDIPTIKEMFLAKHPLRIISKCFNVSEETVRRALLKIGLKRR